MQGAATHEGTSSALQGATNIWQWKWLPILKMSPPRGSFGIQNGVYQIDEEFAKLNRDVALRALWQNSLFSKVVFSSFLSQNNPLVLVGFYQNYMYSCIKRKVIDISSAFSYEKSAGRRYRQCFLLNKSHDRFRGTTYNVNKGKATPWRFWSLHSQRRLLSSRFPMEEWHVYVSLYVSLPLKFMYMFRDLVHYKDPYTDTFKISLQPGSSSLMGLSWPYSRIKWLNGYESKAPLSSIITTRECQ
jgi:hypothetical protein